MLAKVDQKVGLHGVHTLASSQHSRKVATAVHSPVPIVYLQTRQVSIMTQVWWSR